ncbi:MAG: hypothetical protein CVU39_03170 [Chloroflexi bacterium HGW-Chloroflexi-10]|nr:MAG: hypothetical protein CVU39_03170 [Chloroflexi bacterium HGW-Chloroflexi-10]
MPLFVPFNKRIWLKIAFLILSQKILKNLELCIDCFVKLDNGYFVIIIAKQFALVLELADRHG